MTEQVSPLRQRMIDDMTIRNVSVNTQKAYIRSVANFSKHFGRSPDKQVLDHPDIDALFEQMGRKAVPQRMHGNRRIEVGDADGLTADPLYTIRQIQSPLKLLNTKLTPPT